MGNSDYWNRFSRKQSRRSILRGGAIGIVSLASEAAMFGCTSSTPAAPTLVAAGLAPGPSPSAAPAAPKYGGKLVIPSTAESIHGEPQLQGGSTLTAYGAGVVWSRILNYQAGPKRDGLKNFPSGDLAESWQAADDVTWIFKLQPNIKWQNIPPLNGRPFTADDLVYSYNRQRDLKIAYGYLPAFEKVEAVDKNTFKYVQPKPNADFLPVLASVFNDVVPKEAVDINGDLRDGPYIGTGPWVFEKWERDKTVTVVRNPDYFIKGLPYLDRLEFPRVYDDQTRLSALRGKEIHVSTSDMQKADLERITHNDPGLVLTTYVEYGRGQELIFNVTRPPFTDKRVRQAFSKALDRQAIIDKIFDGNARLLPDITLPSPDWHLPEAELKTLFGRDVAGAKRLLAEAGYPNGLEVEMAVLNIGVTYTGPAELWQANLKEAGVNVTLKLLDAANYVAAVLTRGDFQFSYGTLAQNTAINLELFTKYHSTGGRNPAQVKDPKLDEMIERQAVMVHDPEGRKKVLQDLMRYIADELPYGWVLTYVTTTGVWDFVKDYSVGMPNGESSVYTYTWLNG